MTKRNLVTLLLSNKEKEEFPSLVSHEFTIKDKTDLVISGLGWIRTSVEAKVSISRPGRCKWNTLKAII